MTLKTLGAPQARKPTYLGRKHDSAPQVFDQVQGFSYTLSLRGKQHLLLGVEVQQAPLPYRPRRYQLIRHHHRLLGHRGMRRRTETRVHVSQQCFHFREGKAKGQVSTSVSKPPDLQHSLFAHATPAAI